MKTKTITLLTLFTIISFSVFAQLNPVSNLYYNQTYHFPSYCPSYNCFELSWNAPIASNDTLKGYNVYKDQLLYLYTTQTQVSCYQTIPCPYTDFYFNYPFWIKIKAVYNHNNVESIANDSVHVYQLPLKIEEKNSNDFVDVNNPVKAGENIGLLFPAISSNKCILKVVSQNGQTIKQYDLKNVSNSIVNISTTQLSPGIYLITLKLDGKTLSTKLIIQ